jgi:hypothetical protein
MYQDKLRAILLLIFVVGMAVIFVVAIGGMGGH